MKSLTKTHRATHAAIRKFLVVSWKKRPESRMIFRKGKPIGVKAGPLKYPAAITLFVEAKIDGQPKTFRVRMDDATPLLDLKS